MSLELNDLETARFGIPCARLTGDAAPLDAINSAAMAQGIRMVSTRVDVNELDRVHALEADGYRLMDTLVYYARALDNLPQTPPLPEGTTIRRATPADATSVAACARAAFQGYFGHYHADPRLENAAADAAYAEWAETLTTQTRTEAPVLIVEQARDIVGFAALRRNSRMESEGILYGIHYSARRHGLYSALMCQTLHECKAMGTARMIISTQINNYTVQQVWGRLGLAHTQSFYTFHKWFPA